MYTSQNVQWRKAAVIHNAVNHCWFCSAEWNIFNINTLHSRPITQCQLNITKIRVCVYIHGLSASAAWVP